MKKRHGFVSNSSSTSFCIIGTEDTEIIKKLAAAEGKDFWRDESPDWFDHGVSAGENVTFYGDYWPWVAGVPAKDLLEQNVLSAARATLRVLFSAWYDIDVPIGAIDLLYGEAGNG